MMSRSYDIFLSHSGAQKDFVEHLNTELARVCGQYSVFFDRYSIEHGEQISTSILEYAKTCKLAVVVVSEEYFTRSRPPMMELAASYTAAKALNGFPSLPCLLPVFLALRPEDAKDSSTQLGWRKMWQKWEVNEKMSEKRKSGPRRVQPTVWKEAVDRLLDTRGPVYIPREYGYDPEVFLKKVAQVITHKLDHLNGGIGPSKVGNQLMAPYQDVGPREDTGVEEDFNLGLGFNPPWGSGSSRVAGNVTDEKEALPEPYRVVVCLQFGSTYSSFASSHINDPEEIITFSDFSATEDPSCKTATGIYYSSRDGGQSYQVESWGNPAHSRYEQGEQEAGRRSKKKFGMYVTRFNPHLHDTQISTSKNLKLPYSLPVDRPITDFLHEFGSHILHRLQDHYESDLTMKMIQWCVPVPSSWDNAAQEKMNACMESAGLINGADGSPYPVKMVGELEAAFFLSLRELQPSVGDKLVVIESSESFFKVVVQEVVSIDNRVHRVKEVSSTLFTHHSSPDIEFVKRLHREVGPGLGAYMSQYPTDYQRLLRQWNDIKRSIEDETHGEPIKMFVAKELVDIWERYQQMELSGIEWHSDDVGEIEIPYREFQLLFDPVIEELLSCISKTCTEVDGFNSAVLVGDWLAESLYVKDNLRRRFACQETHFTSSSNYDTTICKGAIALAHNLCSR